MFPVSDRPYSEPPTLTFFSLWKKNIKKNKEKERQKTLFICYVLKKKQTKRTGSWNSRNILRIWLHRKPI